MVTDNWDRGFDCYFDPGFHKTKPDSWFAEHKPKWLDGYLAARAYRKAAKRKELRGG